MFCSEVWTPSKSLNYFTNRVVIFSPPCVFKTSNHLARCCTLFSKVILRKICPIIWKISSNIRPFLVVHIITKTWLDRLTKMKYFMFSFVPFSLFLQIPEKSRENKCFWEFYLNSRNLWIEKKNGFHEPLKITAARG